MASSLVKKVKTMSAKKAAFTGYMADSYIDKLNKIK